MSLNGIRANRGFMFLLIFLLMICLSTASASAEERLQVDAAVWQSGEGGQVRVEKQGDFKISGGKVYQDKDGKNVYGFDFKYATEPVSCVYEAEDCEFGHTYVVMKNTQGQYVVNAIGDTTEDFITFENVAKASKLNFYYTNAFNQDIRFSVYVKGQDIADLLLPPTGNGNRVFKYATLKTNEPVEGDITLTIDEEDAEHNNGHAIMLDHIALGDIPEPKNGKVMISMPMPEDIDKNIQSISVLMRGTHAPLKLVLIDNAGKRYESLSFLVDKNKWDRVTVLFEDFDPKPGIEDPTQLKELQIIIDANGIADKGRFEIKDVLLSNGWPSTVPDTSPFEQSPYFSGLRFTGRHVSWGGGDTWYPTWAENDKMYSSFTDGTCDGVTSHSYAAGDAETGQAVITGSDPMDLKVKAIGKLKASALPYGGRYPCGSLVYDGIWYYGTYTLTDSMLPCGNWCTIGPMCGFHISKDYGKTWTPSPHDPAEGGLFGEHGTLCEEKVKFGSPHFVDFGRNMQHSPDGRAYIIAHGATRPEANNTWVSGDQVYMARAIPSPETMNDPDAWEFFSGHDDNGQAVWTDDFEKIKPLFEWQDNTGCVTMTYNEPLKKYITCVSWGWPTIGKFDTYLLESDNITGPFRLLTYMEHFGEQAYFVNIPSKFISEDGKSFWLCYSANFTTPHTPTPRTGVYAFSLHEVVMLKPQK